MFNRRQFLGSTAAAMMQVKPRKPNLLFIVADGWRGQTLLSAGDNELKAPNLARLAKEGVHFSRAYSVNPMRMPARAAMLTGKFPHTCKVPHNDVSLPANEISIADQIKKAGYATAEIGGVDRAIEFIRQNKAAPFYAYVSLEASKFPRDLYDPKSFSIRQNIPYADEGKARERYAEYYARCSALDVNVGSLLAALQQNGIAEDTIVVFTSGHGDMLGSHGLESDSEPYQESAHIPLLMRYPRALAADAAIDMLVSNVRYMPTLLTMCGAEIPAGVQGQDLAQLLTAGTGKRPEAVYCEGKLGQPGEWRMIVRGFDKLVINAKLDPTHFFNLATDPFEISNQATDKTQLRRIDELTAVLKSWMRRTGDRVPYPAIQKRA